MVLDCRAAACNIRNTDTLKAYFCLSFDVLEAVQDEE